MTKIKPEAFRILPEKSTRGVKNSYCKTRVWLKGLLLLTAFSLMPIAPLAAQAASSEPAEPAPVGETVTVNIDPTAERRAISPYIYGLADEGATTVEAVRAFMPTIIFQSGSRMSTYNWETNFSNAGKDAFFTNDRWLADPNAPATPAYAAERLVLLGLSGQETVKPQVIPVVPTLQMSGYAAADGNGPLLDGQNAPSPRWVTVLAQNPASEYNGQPPNTEDGNVYMNEYVGYLKSAYSGFGVNQPILGFSLDFQPDTWLENTKYAHPQPVTGKELIRKSSNLIRVVRASDPKAFVFGGQFGNVKGWVNLNDAEDWSDLKGSHNTFAGYYLQEMKTLAQELSVRTVDALDIHHISQDAAENCINDVYSCIFYHHQDCNNVRVQAPRTLWDPTYAENSWITTNYSQYLPILPTLRAEINTEYPGTLLTVSRYGFGGGGDISGALAAIDAMGIFGKQGVYAAGMLPDKSYNYQQAAMQLFTNYDGAGSSFGETSIKTEIAGDSSVKEFARSYASVAAPSNGKSAALKVIVTNLNSTNASPFALNFSHVDVADSTAEVYSLNGSSAEIVRQGDIGQVDGTFNLTLEPMSAALIVIPFEATSDSMLTKPVTEVTAESLVPGNNEEVSTGDQSAETQDSEKEQSGNDSSTSVTVSDSKNTAPDSQKDPSKEHVPIWLKIAALTLSALTLGGVGYLFYNDWKTR